MRVVIQALALLILLSLPAQAYDVEFDVDVETRLVCDTQKQVERFVEIYKGDVEAAVHSVNAEYEGPPVCDMVTVAYVPLDEVSVVEGPQGKFRVLQIILMGVFTDEGFSFTVPTTYFTMLPVEQNLSELRKQDGILALRQRVMTSVGKRLRSIRSGL
jgi:hypothetical protein